jgi:hypothetical protein
MAAGKDMMMMAALATVKGELRAVKRAQLRKQRCVCMTMQAGRGTKFKKWLAF